MLYVDYVGVQYTLAIAAVIYITYYQITRVWCYAKLNMSRWVQAILQGIILPVQSPISYIVVHTLHIHGV